MENLKKKLESGAELEVCLASFTEGHQLFNAVTKVLKDTDFNNDTVGKLSLDVISSPEIMEAMWPCMGRATYTRGTAPLKISLSLFENADNRSDFLEVVEEVMVFNLTPFSKKIGLLLKTTFLKGIDSPK